MSKQSEAKKRQGYQEKPELHVCSTCRNFTMDLIPSRWNPAFMHEKNLRCGLGGFAVKKPATCNEWSPK